MGGSPLKEFGVGSMVVEGGGEGGGRMALVVVVGILFWGQGVLMCAGNLGGGDGVRMYTTCAGTKSR